MSVTSELQNLAEKMNAYPVHIEHEKDRVFQVDLPNCSLQIKLQAGRVEIDESISAEPNVTLKLTEENFSKLLKGELNTTIAFMTGGLKVEGSMGLALKLQEILRNYQ
ncbi:MULTISPECIES: SCP2 sterol-binding domain-containing protein [unclassified Bacillus (in: firmicutes)]|uniref:SCP2 sterol-binding domain-containing protein n=1 Tax=unclassified Bacillus (in: firmicutes) TaxID=185979 RepID=UPI0008EC15C8|nr:MULTISPECIES: SCP2 sterol-binding domain-containing protein [unclassified Bacillus (in: firmicutes)]SFA87024.1 SCP-2 sterol transfer family protein [Bacillus sp. UNCCL13]SFQ84019.1 SCP-2 sterol transfer family protein [Bacillus sp. cl95]